MCCVLEFMKDARRCMEDEFSMGAGGQVLVFLNSPSQQLEAGMSKVAVIATLRSHGWLCTCLLTRPHPTCAVPARCCSSAGIRLTGETNSALVVPGAAVGGTIGSGSTVSR